MLRAFQWENHEGLGWVDLLKSFRRPAALAAIMFMLMRAELLLKASPLAAALMAAGLAAGESPTVLAAGCLLGLLRFPLNEISLLPAISCAMVLGMELMLRLRRASSETRASLNAGFSVLIPALIHANADAVLSAQALGCAALAAAGAPFMLAALLLHNQRRRLMIQEKAGAALLAGGMLAGAWQLHPGAGETLACLFVLLMPGLGCAAGVFAGLSLAAGGAGLLKTASLALCALGSSTGLCTERWHRALAACAGAGICWLAAGMETLLPQWMMCAAAIYMVLPRRLPGLLDGLFGTQQEAECCPERVAREVTADVRRRLFALGDAFSAMAESCAAPTSVPDEQELICEMRSRLCSGCPGYADCWTGQSNRAVRLLCQLIADALDRVDAPPGMRVLFADGEIPPDILRACRRGRVIPDRLGLLLRDFAEKRRSEIKRCETGQLMSAQFMQAGAILYDLAGGQEAQVSSRGVQARQLCAALDRAGLAGCTALSFGGEQKEISITRPGGEWTRREVRLAGAALARSLGGRFQPQLRGESLFFVRSPRFSANSGASCQSGIAGEICGDSHMVRMLDRSRLLLALSDGMGSGQAAADESLETLRLLWCFLSAGISRPLALETVNRQLLMRSCEDMFATMDLCIIDMNTGIAEFTKLAACRTLLLRGNELLHVEGGHLPLGILERVQPGVSRVRLRPGDMIVMGSDGVMEAGDAMMIERIIRESMPATPEQLAEKLVHEAGLRSVGTRRDDMTCICVQIREAG